MLTEIQEEKNSIILFKQKRPFRIILTVILKLNLQTFRSFFDGIILEYSQMHSFEVLRSMTNKYGENSNRCMLLNVAQISSRIRNYFGYLRKKLTFILV